MLSLFVERLIQFVEHSYIRFLSQGHCFLKGYEVVNVSTNEQSAYFSLEPVDSKCLLRKYISLIVSDCE